MRKVIEKYFKGERTLYYHPADLIAADHYLRYEFSGERVIIHAGCNEGEIPLLVCSTPEELEMKIKSLVY